MKILNLNLRNKILKIFIGLILLTSIVVIPIVVSKQYSNGTMNVNQNNNKNLKNNNDLHIDFLTRIKKLEEKIKTLKAKNKINDDLHIDFLTRIKKLEDRLNSKIDWYENKIKDNKIAFALIKEAHQLPESELH